jgi:hypothetical protein
MKDSNEIKIFLSSPPDRTFLVTEIFIGNEQIAEINRENEKEEIEIYPRRSGEVWRIDFEDLISALQKANRNFQGGLSNVDAFSRRV